MTVTDDLWYWRFMSRRSNYLLSGAWYGEGRCVAVRGEPVSSRAGAFFVDASTSYGSFTDGTSATLMVCEARQGRGLVGPYWGSGCYSSTMVQVADDYEPPGAYLPNRPGKPLGGQAGSWHRGGVNCLFADGGVRFVRDGVGLSVWVGMGTMQGAEIAER